MENVKKFFKALRTDPQAQQLARSFRPPENDDEAVEGYTRLAKTLGFSISREEMAAGLHSLAQAERKKTACAEKEMVRISEESLDGIAAGNGNPGAWYPAYCKDLFVENQWCWYADACAGAINNYTEVIEELRD